MLNIRHRLHRIWFFVSEDWVFSGPQKHPKGFFARRKDRERAFRYYRITRAGRLGGVNWKRRTARMNPWRFDAPTRTSLFVRRHATQFTSALLLALSALWLFFYSPVLDRAIFSRLYEIANNEAGALAVAASKNAREAALAAATASGFSRGMTDDASLTPSLLKKADHLTMSQLETEFIGSLAQTGNEVLTDEEIRIVLQLAWRGNGGLEEYEFRLAKAALLTVGRIPYVLGGAQPNRPGSFETDETGFPLIMDSTIREAADQVRPGMDCSHWADWIYFIGVNNYLGYCNTDNMIYSRGAGGLKLIAVDDNDDFYDEGLSRIRCGDIMVYGHDPLHRYGHAAIFLGYVETDSGRKMMYVHESSSQGNVSLHIGDPFGNNGSSPVFFFRWSEGLSRGIDYDYSRLKSIQTVIQEQLPEDEPVILQEEEEEEPEDIQEEKEEEEKEEVPAVPATSPSTRKWDLQDYDEDEDYDDDDDDDDEDDDDDWDDDDEDEDDWEDDDYEDPRDFEVEDPEEYAPAEGGMEAVP